MNESEIRHLALSSSAARIDWPKRGRAPTGYVQGMAVAYARALQRGFLSPITLAMSKELGSPERDALAYYGVLPSLPPASRLRMTWALLWGLGMRESSGRYCEGRDRSASNTTSNTAEAGLFQMSWDIHPYSEDIVALFKFYPPGDALLDVFKEGVVPRPGDLQNYGSGDGAKFQEMCKTMPQFACDVAAIGLRVVHTHWGPVNTHAAQIRQEVLDLLMQIEVGAPIAVPSTSPTAPAPAPTPPPAVPPAPAPTPPPAVPPAPAPTPPPAVPPAPPVQATRWPAQADCDGFYGNPRGSGGGSSSAWERANLVLYVPPWQMVDEDSGRAIRGITVHRLCRDSLARVMQRAWSWCGRDQGVIEQHRMNVFSGSYVFRNIRGGSNLSMHSYGCALDFAAGANGLGRPWNPNTGIPYEFARMFEEEGWTWGARWTGRPDAMHFQAAQVSRGQPPMLTQPVLRVGSSGPDVSHVQQVLGIHADGEFGDQTHAAVLAFQKTRGLDQDGEVGPQTWKALA